MYIAGQIGLEPSTGQLVSGGAKEEAKQALKNMGEILKAAGCDYGNVVKTTVLMADMKDYNDINDVYKQCPSLTVSLSSSVSTCSPVSPGNEGKKGH
ncbi:Ribonuclease UK114 [Lamprotornis superbus]|uniref:Ribonuclease UK114 n=1 Tax=Lamprotornis superbus TaxID=245042 RepID=A0A835P032_9PASS|nr:Ribonuclease UK114 [Lamprotornis superbus]